MRAPWKLGELFVLRHAGFPFDRIEGLGASDATLDAVARLLEVERAVEDAATATEVRAEKAFLMARESMRRGERPKAPKGASERWAGAVDAYVAAYEEAARAYQSDTAELDARLHALASDVEVQEAVFLSSPDVYENVWARFVARGARAGGASGARRDRRLVYSYLQRLCAKNETTSFFGPMGYGEVLGDDDAVELLPALPQVRRTNVAYWAVEALAAAVAREPALFPHLPLRRNPLFFIDAAHGEARCEALGADGVVPLSHDETRLLGTVALVHTAEGLAAHLGESRAWVESVAMTLLIKGVLLRRLWFASDAADTLSSLCASMVTLPACEARDRWLVALAEVEALRAAFETAPFDERRALLPAIERRFHALTAVPARRAGGRLYTDRLVLNEEASSPFRVRIGKRAAEALEAALSPVLDACAERGEQAQAAAKRAVTEALAGRRGGVGFLDYAATLRGLPRAEPDGGDTKDAAGPLPTRHSDDGPRFALPDLCIGRDPDGSVRYVVSSLHHQLLTRGWLFAFHDDPARVDAVASSWLGATDGPPFFELATGRHNKGFYSFPGARAAHAPAELTPGRADRPIVAASDCTVHIEQGEPVLRAPDGTSITLYVPLADLTLHTPFTALTSPPVLLPSRDAVAQEARRIEPSGLTVTRARWTLPVAAWDDLRGFPLFVAMARERARLGLPRFVFARVPGERKPFLVDTTSPFALDLLRHVAREATEVRLEEMLPSPDQLWLRDDRGRYTFELRIQATRGAAVSEALAAAE